MRSAPTFAPSCRHQFLRSMRRIHDNAFRILLTSPDREGDREGVPFVLRRRAGGGGDAERDRDNDLSEDCADDLDSCTAGILTPQSYQPNSDTIYHERYLGDDTPHTPSGPMTTTRGGGWVEVLSEQTDVAGVPSTTRVRTRAPW